MNGCAPLYLLEHCIPVSSADTRRHLCSANRHLLAVPRFRLNTYGRRAFSAAGPMTWNSLPDFIRDPTSSTDCFRCLLSSALGVLNNYALYKSMHSLTHSLTHCVIHSVSWPTLSVSWFHCRQRASRCIGELTSHVGELACQQDVDKVILSRHYSAKWQMLQTTGNLT